MTLDEFLAIMAAGERAKGGSEAHLFMIDAASRAQQITAQMNGSYKTPAADSRITVESPSVTIALSATMW